MGNIVYFGERGKEHMANILEVARYFLSKESMTHLKLQKICYYAQAWYFALKGKPLMNDYFEAWMHGPVCPHLYQQYKSWGWYNIARYEGEIRLDNETKCFLDKIFSLYGGFSGDELERLTHSEEPWIKARRGLNPDEYCKNTISEEDMKNYYRGVLNR